MTRRHFTASAASAVSAASLATVSSAAAQQGDGSNRARFRLKYAPHEGMFREHAGGDYLDQLKFAADEGFTAWEDNGMMNRPPEQQERIAKTMAELGLTMGVFVAYADFERSAFTAPKEGEMEQVLGRMRAALECAKRVNATWMTVVPGTSVRHLEWDYQTAAVVENLKRCAEIFEPEGKVMVLEPLNAWANHPGCFLTRIPQAYQICRAVDSPACKILDDFYHQQITEGNLIPNFDRARDEIAYTQVGDNPGRKEPTTGEINYRNVFRHLHRSGYDGVVGMEHGNSRAGREGERAVIDAYRWCDDFES